MQFLCTGMVTIIVLVLVAALLPVGRSEPLSAVDPSTLFPAGQRPTNPTPANAAPNRAAFSTASMNADACDQCFNRDGKNASNFCPTNDGGACYTATLCNTLCAVSCVTSQDSCAIAAQSFPTNAWWSAMALSGQSLTDVASTTAITPYPYSIKATHGGLFASAQLVELSSKPGSPQSVGTPFSIGLGVESSLGSLTRQITGYSGMSVSLTWVDATGSAAMSTTLTRGDGFASLMFLKAAGFTIKTNRSIKSINGWKASPHGGEQATNPETIFKIVLAGPTATSFPLSPPDETWVVYLQKPVKIIWSSSIIKSSDATYEGMIRIRKVGTYAHQQDQNAASCVIASSTANISTNAAGNTVVRYSFKAATWGSSDPTDAPCAPLVYLLPHHVYPGWTLLTFGGGGYGQQVLEASTIRGTLTPIVATWVQVTISDELGYLPSATLAGLGLDFIDPIRDTAAVRTSLVKDAETYVAANANPFSSDFSKFAPELGALARLTHIADTVGDNATRSSLLKVLDDQLVRVLGNPANTSQPSLLRYDAEWGGICTANGLQSITEDGGNGWYDLHHIQYGQVIFAGAVSAALGGAAYSKGMREPLLALIRDIASPSEDDPYFATFRTFDMYETHGVATGNERVEGGKGQLQVASSLMAWYGVQQLGRVWGTEELVALGTQLLTLESLSALTYWAVQHTPLETSFATHAPVVYPPAYTDGKTVAGVVRELSVEFGGVRETASASSDAARNAILQGLTLAPLSPAIAAVVNPCWGLLDGGLLDQGVSSSTLAAPFKMLTAALFSANDAAAAAGMISAASDSEFTAAAPRTLLLAWALARPGQLPAACKYAVPPSEADDSDFLTLWLCATLGLSLFACFVVEVRRCVRRAATRGARKRGETAYINESGIIENSTPQSSSMRFDRQPSSKTFAAEAGETAETANSPVPAATATPSASPQQSQTVERRENSAEQRQEPQSPAPGSPSSPGGSSGRAQTSQGRQASGTMIDRQEASPEAAARWNDEPVQDSPRFSANRRKWGESTKPKKEYTGRQGGRPKTPEEEREAEQKAKEEQEAAQRANERSASRSNSPEQQQPPPPRQVATAPTVDDVHSELRR